MDMIDNLVLGFGNAVSFYNLVYVFIGCFVGTLIGVLPGLSPLATVAILMPFTYGLEPLTALIMLAGIYYGSQYGGSTTAILVNLPGESSSVVTMLDGHQMARQGRAGVALATAALSSFFAGTVGTLVLAAFATPMSKIALSFGAAEYFALMVVGLLGAVVLASGSAVKAVGMVLIGLLLGLVGTDVQTGTVRFTLGLPQLWDGLDFIVVAVGIFAFTEVLTSLEMGTARESFTRNISSLWPTREDFRRIIPATLRGTALGSAIGSLPGSGVTLASFIAYTVEKKVARNPEKFGKGAIEGVAAPEAANNAAAQTGFIPTLTLGVPGSATMALMLGAMMIHNIQPGPMVMVNNPGLFWGLIASMWIGNLVLLVLNLPLIGLWVQILKVPFRVLYPAILVFCCIGVFSARSSDFDILLAAGVGGVGYMFHRFGCEPAPLVLGLVLGPLLEENFRRAMLLSGGDFSIFVTRPITLGLLVCAALLLVLILLPAFRSKREEIFAED